MPLWGKTDENVSKPKYLDRGQIVAVNITDGGSGYDSAPTVDISAPTSGTQATATAEIADGVVTGITITNPGSGYTAADTITVSFSGGTPDVDAEAEAIYHGAAYNDGIILFVDQQEALVAANRAKGLVSPGWWLYRTYTDSGSTTRHKSELLIPMRVSAEDAGDASDDASVADLTITIDTQPVGDEIESGDDITLTVVASTNGVGTLTYQWYDATDPEVLSAVEGATTDTLVLENVTSPAAYYVIVSLDGIFVISDTANITIAAPGP